jgi:hypothetical protein
MQRLALAIAALIVIPLPAHANRLQPQDAQDLDALNQQLLVARQDNLDVQRSLTQNDALNLNDCLNEISTSLETLSANLSSISTLVHISSSMVSDFDEKVVNGNLLIDLNSALRFLPIARRYANQNSGFCGSSAIVATRAQTALRLFDESERILQWLKRRF